MENPLDPGSESLFGPAWRETPAELAAALAVPAQAGHFDELRGGIFGPGAHGLPVRAWARFFENLGREGFADLNRRTVNLQRQVRDNGISYNLYADAGGPQRPWALDLFPLILTPRCWQQIEAGVLQRARLLERILADTYGPQHLMTDRLLPRKLVEAHTGYLRPMQGARPAGGRYLHIAAFDLARDPQGNWWVVSQRTQSPAGLGYLLENRLVISRLFPEAFRDLKIQRLAATYRALADSLTGLCPGDEEPRIVLLTPGPHNETYFEHAYLARHLGLTLVEGSDLTVRSDRLYLKTLKGLEPVHGVLKRLDDEFLDPRELRSDSQLGVPGLLGAIRAGHVLMANAPGSGFLESTALLGYLPAMSEALLGESLRLPSLPTWWCGDAAARQAALAQMAAGVIRPTHASGGAVMGPQLSARQLEQWAGRIESAPDAYTVQSYLPLSQMPTWKTDHNGDHIAPRSLMLRVFAVSDGAHAWRVLPGGLTRIMPADAPVASLQRGPSSADTWVMAEGEAIDGLAHEQPSLETLHACQRSRTVTSRAAENLFWLGRYSERTENTARLARLALESLNGEEQSSRPLMAWLSEMVSANGLVPPSVAPATQARRPFERAMVASLGDMELANSVGYNLTALRKAASAVRERLSQQHWNIITRAEQEFLRGCLVCSEDSDHSCVEALRVLETLSAHMAAITGAQIDRMARDDGWRLMAAGRQLERLAFHAQALITAFETEAVSDDSGFEAVVALFDTTIAFHAQYQQHRDIASFIDALVLDRENPRSLAWVAQRLRTLLQEFSASAQAAAPLHAIPDPCEWDLNAPGGPRKEERCPAALSNLLQGCVDAAYELSDTLTARYFNHSR